MKQIPLTQGKVALVDDEDFEWLNQWKWWAKNGGHSSGNFYAARTINKKDVFMHRVLMNTPVDMITDHINGNGLDNRRCNLRICTFQGNARNSKIRTDNTSGHKGIRVDKNGFTARIKVDNKEIYLGYFKEISDAVFAYENASKNFFGEFSRKV